ncbi:hypothetical protein HDU82_009052 [Entophlyctis luteolus]|nr:hypothetical protein HDU82_009052 [Entophlyctis luteolus]
MFSLFNCGDLHNDSEFNVSIHALERDFGDCPSITAGIDPHFLDWQGRFCPSLNPEQDSHTITADINPDAAIDESFLAAVEEGFGSYFSQTENSGGNQRNICSGRIQNSLLSEIADSGSSADPESSETQVIISMADVLPQRQLNLVCPGGTGAGTMPTQIVSKAEQCLPVILDSKAQKSKDKKLKDKGLCNQKKAKETTLISNEFVAFLPLASAADAAHGTTESAIQLQVPQLDGDALIASDSPSAVVAAPADGHQIPGTQYPSQLCSFSSHSLQADFTDSGSEYQGQALFETDAQTPHFVDADMQSEFKQDDLAYASHLQSTSSILPPQQSLVQPPPTGKHKREKQTSHTPRPPNSFIIYRKEKHAELMAQSSGTSTLNNNVISKIVGTMWKQEPPEVKAMYAAKAQEEKRAHMLRHPDYKYRPKKSPPKHGTSSNTTRHPDTSTTDGGSARLAGYHKKGSSGGVSAGSFPASRSGSVGLGGMGMAMLEEFQYCNVNASQDMFIHPYQTTYEINPATNQQRKQAGWKDGDGKGEVGEFVPMYWTVSQLQDQHESSQHAVSD